MLTPGGGGQEPNPGRVLQILSDNNNNLYCALDTKSVQTLKGNNCEKKRAHAATQK